MMQCTVVLCRTLKFKCVSIALLSHEYSFSLHKTYLGEAAYNMNVIINE